MHLKKRAPTDLQVFAPDLDVSATPGANSDVAVILNGNVLFYVNNLVIADSSPLLKQAIINTNQLELDEVSVSKDDILICFRWLYGCSCDVTSLETALAVYKFGNRYKVRELVHVLRDWITDTWQNFIIWEVVLVFRHFETNLRPVLKDVLHRKLGNDSKEVFDNCFHILTSDSRSLEDRGFVFTQMLNLFDINHIKRFIEYSSSIRSSNRLLVTIPDIASSLNSVIEACTQALSSEIGEFFTPDKFADQNKVMATILNNIQNQTLVYPSALDATIMFLLSSEIIRKLTITSNMGHILGFCEWTPVPVYVKLEIAMKWVSNHTGKAFFMQMKTNFQNFHLR